MLLECFPFVRLQKRQHAFWVKQRIGSCSFQYEFPKGEITRPSTMFCTASFSFKAKQELEPSVRDLWRGWASLMQCGSLAASGFSSRTTSEQRARFLYMYMYKFYSRGTAAAKRMVSSRSCSLNSCLPMLGGPTRIRGRFWFGCG